MMLLKCYSQYASKFGKLSSGHRTGKCQFSFQSQRRAMPKNVLLLLLLLSRFSHVRLCATPWTAAHQVSPSMGFSRQEHFLLQCMKVKSESEVAQSCPTLRDPMDCSLPGSSIHGIFPATVLEWSAIAFSQECSNYRAIAFISYASKVTLKSLQTRLQQYVNHELPDVQAGFRKGRGTRDQIANICWIIEKAREFQENISFCFIDYKKDFDCVDHNKLWKILKEMGLPDYLTCLLRNLCAGQEATVRTGHGTMDWFVPNPTPLFQLQLGKELAYLTYV